MDGHTKVIRDGGHIIGYLAFTSRSNPLTIETPTPRITLTCPARRVQVLLRLANSRRNRKPSSSSSIPIRSSESLRPSHRFHSTDLQNPSRLTTSPAQSSPTHSASPPSATPASHHTTPNHHQETRTIQVSSPWIQVTTAESWKNHLHIPHGQCRASRLQGWNMRHCLRYLLLRRRSSLDLRRLGMGGSLARHLKRESQSTVGWGLHIGC